jgi:hypothetical protein
LQNEFEMETPVRRAESNELLDSMVVTRKTRRGEAHEQPKNYKLWWDPGIGAEKPQ